MFTGAYINTNPGLLFQETISNKAKNYLFSRDKEHSILSLSSVDTLQFINQETNVPLKMLVFHLQRKHTPNELN